MRRFLALLFLFLFGGGGHHAVDAGDGLGQTGEIVLAHFLLGGVEDATCSSCGLFSRYAELIGEDLDQSRIRRRNRRISADNQSRQENDARH